MVETKTENNIFLVKKSEIVHCHTKPHTCIFIAQNMQYYIPENTSEIDRRWDDIKVTIRGTKKKEWKNTKKGKKKKKETWGKRDYINGHVEKEKMGKIKFKRRCKFK